MLLTESQVVSALRWAGVRESIRTLTVLGHLVRVVNRYGVHYMANDVATITGTFR